MKRAQAFKKSDYTEKTPPGNLPLPFEAPFEKVVLGAGHLCHKALGELREDAGKVGKALSGFPYSSAARLAGATLFMFVLWQLWNRFGSMKSKLNRLMR